MDSNDSRILASSMVRSIERSLVDRHVCRETVDESFETDLGLLDVWKADEATLARVATTVRGYGLRETIGSDGNRRLFGPRRESKLLRCRSCGHDNEINKHWCVECGTALLAERRRTNERNTRGGHDVDESRGLVDLHWAQFSSKGTRERGVSIDSEARDLSGRASAQFLKRDKEETTVPTYDLHWPQFSIKRDVSFDREPVRLSNTAPRDQQMSKLSSSQASSKSPWRREKEKEKPLELFSDIVDDTVLSLDDSLDVAKETWRRGGKLFALDCERSLFLSLPDEILLHVLGWLSPVDLCSLAATCTRCHRLAKDQSLWSKIYVSNRTLRDSWLAAIGQCQPRALALVQCNGEKTVTAHGLRQLFRSASTSLKELNVSGCHGGEWTGNSILLHASSRCHRVRVLNISWSKDVSLPALEAIIDANRGLTDLDLSGCSVRDTHLEVIGSRLGKNIARLHLSSLCHISTSSIENLLLQCKNLVDLNLGRCLQVTRNFIANISDSIKNLQRLELLGCKKMTDSCVETLVRCCPLLTYVGLSHCGNITDQSLTYLATSESLRSLDVGNCSVSDSGVCALARTRLVQLSLESTRVSDVGLRAISQDRLSASLETLGLSFCHLISAKGVGAIVEELKKIVLYGCKGIGRLPLPANSSLRIEIDKK